MTLVFIGFFCGLGALFRYALGHLNQKKLPLGTLLINLSTCFLAGFFYRFSAESQLYPILAAGFLGGLGTYSTLNYELIRLFPHKKWFTLYFCLTYGGGLLLVWLGLTL
ncbi:fluoride efflux transporter CrcB [Streptococcus oriscaviae]|uniref:Fluoride-specific ion channel FluC n=1 Tax=Streptococcus oriscaviae TaxID=2781599 RepID=A0ABX7YKM6_9STRE|nr:fluoride efflux transporter CrcB [Streptococcus oriscaviae]QUE54340.1 fluoride efflux transporter CrcB [Streptococcus oriscaviae]